MSTLPRIALTGLHSATGSALIRRLQHRGARLVGSDLSRPAAWSEGDPFESIDLRDRDAAERLASLWRREGVEAVVHTAFPVMPDRSVRVGRRPTNGPQRRRRSVERAGTARVLRACTEAGVSQLLLASSTMLYGPHFDNALYLSENDPLRGHPDAPRLQEWIEAEHSVAAWRRRHANLGITVLRSAWALGPRVEGRVATHFAAPRVRVLSGYDPLMQFIHEDDRARYYEAALRDPRPGVYNLVGSGVAPLRTLLRIAGIRALPLPRPLWRRIAERSGHDDVAAFYDYLRYAWVADGSRATAAFGAPHYTTQEAWMSFHSARRLGEAG